MSVDWTPAMKLHLQVLLKGGDTYEECAERISSAFNVTLTKNACVGMGRRLQVPLRMPARKKRCLRRGSLNGVKPRKVQPSARRSLPNPRKRKLKAHPLRQRKHRGQQNRLKDLTLLQLLPTSCRWPIGNNPPFLFCGKHQIDGSSYCEEHHRITHYRSSR